MPDLDYLLCPGSAASSLLFGLTCAVSYLVLWTIDTFLGHFERQGGRHV